QSSRLSDRERPTPSTRRSTIASTQKSVSDTRANSMMRKQCFVVAAAFLAVLCSCLPLHAQSLTGTITGRVLDQQGGALPGATVTATGKTGSQTQVTDARGEFRFVGLSVGTYSVLAELPGFSKREEQALDLGIGNTIDLKLELKVSGVSESVQVTAS